MIRDNVKRILNEIFTKIIERKNSKFEVIFNLSIEIGSTKQLRSSFFKIMKILNDLRYL